MGGARDLANAVAEINRLDQNFIVEGKILAFMSNPVETFREGYPF